MKMSSGKLIWVAVLLLAAVGILAVVFRSPPDARGPQLVAETRQALRQQGFLTDLADFDFSTSPDLRARETTLRATVPNQSSRLPADQPNLMETVGTNSAIVVWRQDSLRRQYRSWPDNGDEMTWDEFGGMLNESQPALDAACRAALSGPIRFNLDASAGDAMLLPHLAMLKNLIQMLDSRAVFALHHGNPGAAWTNLSAATCLVTAWEPEPVEISHLVRFGNTRLVFNATWQMLQAGDWPSGWLAQLQAKWESVNFFTNLPETAAFKRASDVAFCRQERLDFLEYRPPFNEFCEETLQSPSAAWSGLYDRWSYGNYLQYGIYEDESNLLLFYRDQEIELRNAVPAPTWLAMRQLPGVTNRVLFQSKYNTRIQAMLNIPQHGIPFPRQGSSFLGRAAEAEAERRIIITALALERYREKYSSYPPSLKELTPEFLKNPLPDFMDGRPLRYRLTDDGQFLLYSIGLDCVEDGGKFPSRSKNVEDWRTQMRSTGVLGSDILWPLPASTADVAALRQRQKRAEELQALSELDRESAMDWQQSPLRQTRVPKILAMNWSSTTNMEVYAGRPVVEIISNEKISITNHLSLAELLTPRQIITGNEPEELTFEAPIRYDVITNLGALVLLVDADSEEPGMPDSGARIQDCNRAGNGDCLLVWHAIFDPPGRHAVQVQLILSTRRGGQFFLKGPAVSVVTTNLCQFSLASTTYDVERGAILHARLPEMKGTCTVECVTTNGAHLKTLTGSTTNGELNLTWNLVDDQGHPLTGETFNSIVHVTLPDSGRSQTLRGP